MATGHHRIGKRAATRRRYWRGGVVCLCGLLAGVCAGAQGVAYRTELVWEADEAARLILAPHAVEAFEQEEGAPSSILHLRRRAEHQRGFFMQAMRSLGYYAGDVEIEIDPSGAPVLLRYTLRPGARFTIEEVSVLPAEGVAVPGDAVPDPSALPVKAGEPAEAGRVIAAEAALTRLMREAGHPFAEVVRREAVVDHVTRGMRLTFHVDPGPRAAMGGLSIEGLERTRERVVLREMPWEPGDPYALGLIDELQARLYRTDLFSVVRARHADAPDEDGLLPVAVSVSERKHRTLALGLRYYTDDGGGARAQWEDRNLHGLGHRLRLGLDLTNRRQGLGGGYRIPRFRRPDQELGFTFDMARETTDAYESIYFSSEALVERRVTPRLTLGAGLGARISQVDRESGTRTFHFLYTPLRANYDRSNDALNPTSGYRAGVRLTPYANVRDFEDSFVKLEGNVAVYWPLDAEATWVLAARAGAGMLGGASLGAFPEDLRYYAGGGGSVRGYGYQMAGPLRADDSPVGGRSLLETAVEIRYRLSETIGLAAFVDAGTVYNSPFPDFSESLRVGAGAGIRYYTPLGPFRFDVATPVNPRDADSRLQFYLSVGQAF
jgi:translocation and assembly module TamA